MVFLHYRISDGPSQAPTGRRRRCLLKGCESWFQPRCPQARYCSAVCQQEAEWWRRWRGSQRYRASDGGKTHRRDQSRRYRQRRRQSAAAPDQADTPGPAGPGPVASAPEPVVATATVSRGDVAAETLTSADMVVPTAQQREGQRPAESFGTGEGQSCDRPGCYCLFVPKRCAPGQRFCCAECCRALRRVLDREARWRQRRRRRWQQQRWGWVRPP